MSVSQAVERDERTVAIENASYRVAYLVLSFGLLACVVVRSVLLQQATWDLMGLVIGAGLLCAIYQVRHSVLGPTWAVKALLVACLAGAVAAVLALLR